MGAKFDMGLIVRVKKLREGLEPQPLAKLMAVQPSLKDNAAKLRRILCSRVYPNDAVYVGEMEAAKIKLMKSRE